MVPQNSWAKCSMMREAIGVVVVLLIFLHNNGIFRFNAPIPGRGRLSRTRDKTKDRRLRIRNCTQITIALLCIQNKRPTWASPECNLNVTPMKRVLSSHCRTCSSSSNAYEIGSARNSGRRPRPRPGKEFQDHYDFGFS